MAKIDLTEKLKEELMKRNLFEQDDEDEEDNDDDDDAESDNKEEESSNSNEDFCEMACQLLHSQTQVHIFHLGTKSYSEHKALQKFYESADGLIESFQGKYGILTNYKSFKNQSYKNKNQVLKYFTSLLNTIEEKRDCCDDSYIQNQIDTVQELIYSTMYKLKFLQ